jgi:UMF1 family MFS transporter
LAVRLSLASAGVWWFLFTFLFPQQRLVARVPTHKLSSEYVIKRVAIIIAFFLLVILGWLMPWIAGLLLLLLLGLIGALFLGLWRPRHYITWRYLIAYLIYNDGIQTVIVVATSFAADELGVETQTLLLLVLLVQFMAFGGALLFSYLARRIGAKKAIMLSLVIWSGLVIYAYLFLNNETQLFVMGAVLALVLGGSQALSRSLFSQMIPADHEAEYFGFYEISERGTSWIGPLVFAAAVQLTGSQRIAIVSLIIFFVVGLILLTRVNVRQAMLDAGNDPSGVVL